MKIRRILLSLLLTFCAGLGPGYPNKPIRTIVGFGAGGNTDVVTRAFAEELGKRVKTPVVVENRPGAGGWSAPATCAPQRGTATRFSVAPCWASTP
jgi:tripartite-type tricarboxylate transporter receptor subunit TctC